MQPDVEITPRGRRLVAIQRRREILEAEMESAARQADYHAQLSEAFLDEYVDLAAANAQLRSAEFRLETEPDQVAEAMATEIEEMAMAEGAYGAAS